jgi:hypothetical protein
MDRNAQSEELAAHLAHTLKETNADLTQLAKMDMFGIPIS